ncbi:hypothetical protein ABIA24_003290 [Sinorhizobium fredii]
MLWAPVARTGGGLFSGVVTAHFAPPNPLRKSPKSAAEGTSGGVLNVPLGTCELLKNLAGTFWAPMS